MRTLKNNRPIRRGLAPLEMLIALPTLVALIVLLFYVGRASIQQIEFANTLHFDSWRVRYDDQPSDVEPFDYDDAEQGKIDKNKDGTVKTNLFFDKMNHQKKSECEVFANPWNANSNWPYKNFGAVGWTAKQKGNQRIFYFQTKDKTYMNNLPLFEKKEGVQATPIRNTEYVENVGDEES